jgi:hypothetical protein
MYYQTSLLLFEAYDTFVPNGFLGKILLNSFRFTARLIGKLALLLEEMYTKIEYDLKKEERDKIFFSNFHKIEHLVLLSFVEG